jgi:hypothetical protein
LTHNVTLPLIRGRIGRSMFDGMAPRQRSVLLASGAISATSWYVPLVLGAAPQLNFSPALPILLAYALLLAAAVLMTQGLARVVLPRTAMIRLSRAEYDALVSLAARAPIPTFVTFPAVRNVVDFRSPDSIGTRV